MPMPTRGQMPPSSPEELNAQSQAGAAAAFAEAVPPAVEPLDPTLINTLADVAVRVAGTLAGDELGDLQLQPVAGEQQALPGDVYALLSAFDAFTQAALPEKKFDLPGLVTSNSGLKELAGIVEEIGQTGKKAARGPVPEKKAAPEPEKKKDLNPDRFMKES